MDSQGAGATPGLPLLTAELPGEDLLDDFELLSYAVRNERMTEDLLEYKHSLVERVQDKLNQQESLIEEISKDMGQELPRTAYTLSLMRMRYLLKAYWKARLAKIERYATAILDDRELQERCSPKEVRYCLDYFVASGRCLKEVVLQGLPAEFQTLVQESQLTDTKDMLPQPKLDGYVFVKALRDVDSVTVHEGDFERGPQVVHMKAGDLYVVKYGQVARLVHSDMAVLV